MVTMNTFNNPNVLNVFTDASVFKNGEEQITSHGIYDPKNDVKGFTIVRQSSNNRGELMGLISAITYALPLRNKYFQINIWTDSLYSMKCICEWFPGWYFRMQDGVIYTGGNKNDYRKKPVENADLISTIIHLILDNNFDVNILHQRGHIVERNNLQQAIKTFKSSNGIEITQDAMSFAAVCNQVVDEYTRNGFLSVNPLSIPIYTYPIWPYFTYNLDISRLRFLTRKRGDLVNN